LPPKRACLPAAAAQAWVFAALDDEEASVLYYSLAFIYALPYLANGFELDAFALLALLICVVHVQVWAAGTSRSRAEGCIHGGLASADRGGSASEAGGVLPARTSTPPSRIRTPPPFLFPAHHAYASSAPPPPLQLERVAQTEPVEVELPSVLRRLVGGIPQAVRSLGRYSSRLGTQVGGRTRSAEEAAKRRPDRCSRRSPSRAPDARDACSLHARPSRLPLTA
jgi:hypothetical protein